MYKQFIIFILCSLTVVGCTRKPQTPAESKSKTATKSESEPSSMSEPEALDNQIKVPAIVFLTRDGCVNTPTMRKNLDTAIASLKTGMRYELLNQGTLVSFDSRRGYPTPTILLDGYDMFGLPEPLPPFPSPS